MSMELMDYTKKELVGMLEATFEPLDFYANLELTAIAGGKPFALEHERHANKAAIKVRQIQKEALARIAKKPTPKVVKNAKRKP